MGEIASPEPILIAHSLDAFDCGNQTLNQWLKRQVMVNENDTPSVNLMEWGSE
jgi:hypothetical protein